MTKEKPLKGQWKLLQVTVWKGRNSHTGRMMICSDGTKTILMTRYGGKTHLKKCIGEWVFSFDKKTEFNMFRDYPHALTSEQKKIFDEENPYWKEFFKDRI